MSRTDGEYLDTAILHLGKALEHAGHGVASELVQDAVAMRLMAGLDALLRVDDVSIERILGEDSRLVRGFRNRLAHGYATVDPQVLRLTVAHDLPELLSALQRHREQHQE